MNKLQIIIQALTFFFEGVMDDLYKVVRQAVRAELADQQERGRGATPNGSLRGALSLKESAEYTGLSESSLRRQARRGYLDITKIGGRSVVRTEELDRLLREGGGSGPGGGHGG